jgi:hypothetical protein
MISARTKYSHGLPSCITDAECFLSSLPKLNCLVRALHVLPPARSSTTMYARFARQALRRGLHTASSSAKATPRFSNAAKFAVGASSAATALLTWNLMSEKNRVYLDSPSKSSSESYILLKCYFQLIITDSGAPYCSETNQETNGTGTCRIDTVTARSFVLDGNTYRYPGTGTWSL